MTVYMTIFYFFLLEIMVHKHLGCLADDDGSYSKLRIGGLLIGLVYFSFFIWLIVLSVQIGDKEHNKVIPPSTTETPATATTPGMKIFLFIQKIKLNNRYILLSLINVKTNQPTAFFVVTEPTSPSGSSSSTPTEQTSPSGASSSTPTQKTSPSGASSSTTAEPTSPSGASSSTPMTSTTEAPKSKSN